LCQCAVSSASTFSVVPAKSQIQVIDRIFSPESTGHLPHAVPLPQLVDLMTDLWEADGLFD